MIKCNVCQTENTDDALICRRCGISLVKVGLAATGKLEIGLNGGEFPIIQIDAPGVEGYVIGRLDDGNEFMPDVDLSNFDARNRGVSRRHAALVHYRGVVHVIDLNSANGTFLNSKKLTPEVAYPLNTGDELRVGNLNLYISKAKRT